MDTRNYGLKWVGVNVQLGKGGARIKDNAGVIEARNAADDSYAVLRAANPVAANDVVTKDYLETRASVYVSSQIDGSVPTAAGAAGVFALVTTAGNGFALGEIYRSDGSSWVSVPVTEGMTISVTDALTGGTDEYLADHRYLWDEDGSTWIDVWPAASVSAVVKTNRATLAFDTSSPLNIGGQVPANSIVTKVTVNVTTAFDGTTESTLEVGESGDTGSIASTDEVDLATVGVYVIDAYKLYAAQTQVIGTYVQDAATQGAASILMEYSVQ